MWQPQPPPQQRADPLLPLGTGGSGGLELGLSLLSLPS